MTDVLWFFGPQYIDYIAFIAFIGCLLVSLSTRQFARTMPATGKEIRSRYRSSWIKNMLENRESKLVVDEMRNNVTVSVALVSGIIIAFGLVVSNVLSITQIITENSIVMSLKISSVILILSLALFMILSELRLLLYIPIIFGTDEELIKAYEKTTKVRYISKLVHEAFDNFANTMREIFYAVVLMIWFYNPYIFLMATVLLTIVMIREDFGRGSRISIF